MAPHKPGSICRKKASRPTPRGWKKSVDEPAKKRKFAKNWMSSSAEEGGSYGLSRKSEYVVRGQWKVRINAGEKGSTDADFSPKDEGAFGPRGLSSHE